MQVNMRSWDLVWGLSYDVPCFTAVQQVLASALRLSLGPYTHVVGSGHIYQRHYDLVPAEADELLKLNTGELDVAGVQDSARWFCKYLLSLSRGEPSSPCDSLWDEATNVLTPKFVT